MPDTSRDLINFPWAEPPGEGTATELAEGVLWIRLPLPMVLNHINVYALDDGDSWTIVDTGVHSRRSVGVWETLLAGPLQGRPVGRVLLTHAHPDHVGMAGWLKDRFGAELVTSRTAYLTARMLILDIEETPTPQALDLWRSAGMDPAIYAERAAQRPFNFSDMCAPLSIGYTRVQQGNVLRAGGRDWDVHIGNGHAPEHVTLWSRDDDLVLAGDQILPSISPNISVAPGEPAANPLADWLESCERLGQLARTEHVVLGGHNLPFTGLPLRMHALAENHYSALDRLRDHLRTPRTVAECFPVLFRREIGKGIYGLALGESLAHLNWLLHAGEVTRTRRDDGAWLWQS